MKNSRINKISRIKVIILLLPFNIFSQINLDDGLIAYYPFCGNAIDESSNENNGSINEAILIEDRFGNIDGAYKFDGIDDYIDCGNNNTLNQNFNELTISSWINIIPGGESQQQIIGKWNNTVSNDHFTVILNNNKILLAIANPNNSASGFSDDRILEYNTWYQIIVTWDNEGRHRVYINKNLGLDIVSPPFNWISTSSGISLKIGRQINPSQHNRAFNGLIDDVRIYDRILNQAEIDSLHNINPKQIISSITNKILTDKIKIFPNPSSEFINIKFPPDNKDYNINIFDINGKLISNFMQIRNNYVLNTTQFSKGIIFVNIYNESLNITKKVILN